jgi:uncharacterized secreted protein with C-terminal beta-propeller domain
VEVSTARLVAVDSCDQAVDGVRSMAMNEMNKRIDDAISNFEQNGCGLTPGSDENSDRAASGPQAGNSTTGGSGSSGTSAPKQTSGTNNQVAGVDEADFLKNDGRYIYLAQNGALRIVEAWPAASTREVSVTKLQGTPKKLFVEKDRALIYLSVARNDQNLTGPDSPPYYGRGECTYGYDCDFRGDGSATRLAVFDLTDRSAPKQLRTIELSGSLIAARRIGSAVHTVVSQAFNPFPELQYYPQEGLCNYTNTDVLNPPISAEQTAREAYERLREENRKIILNKPLEQLLPFAKDSASNAGLDYSALCRKLYRSPLNDGNDFTSLVSFDLQKSEPFSSTSIFSRAGAVYASSESLYVAVRQDSSFCQGWYRGHDTSEELTSIHKFKISANPSQIGYVGSGLVKGHPLNQFAMDEFNGDLRVATTSGWVPSPNVSSQVTVLRDGRDGLLTRIGLVEGLGPKEDIRSVRFDGERGFIVTFKKTDPLFSLDLSNPNNPRVLGELKIPGFSTYMHMLDANHLISIGYDADDHSSFAYFSGVLIQIFDVSNPSSPSLKHKYVIGTRGSSSEALTNHLAFNYFEPLKVLSLPMTVCEGGGDGKHGDRLTFSGLMLFNIDVAQGIRERGRVAHPLPSITSPRGYNYTCGNWWTQAHSEVKRSIFFDNFVYSISTTELKVQDVNVLGADLANVPLK